MLPKEPSVNLDDQPGRTGRGATELGRAVHAVLQHIDLTAWDETELAELSERMAEEHAVGGRMSEVIDLARTVLGTATMQRASAAAKRGQAWREVSVAAALGNDAGELEGQIDLMFREEDGSLCVVDYKTDQVKGRDIADAAGPYMHQLGGYAWCVEQVTGMTVSSGVLIFARGESEGVSGEYILPDLESLKYEATELAKEKLSAVTT